MLSQTQFKKQEIQVILIIQVLNFIIVSFHRIFNDWSKKFQIGSLFLGYNILILGTLKQNMLEIFIKTCKVISKNEKKYV